MRHLRDITQTVVDTIIDTVNVLPKIKIKKPDFPEIRIDLPRLDLPHLKIDLKPDLRSLEEMKRISKDVGAELNQSLKETGATFSLGWQWAKVIIILFAIWVVALLITIFDGMRRNIYRGWKMVLGRQAHESAD